MDVLEGYTYLTRALETKTYDEFKLVVDSETKSKLNGRNKDTTTVLMVAAALDNHRAVRLLLKRGARADLKTKDSLGWNALHIAAKAGSVRSARILLEDDRCKLDVNFESKTGRTALALAVGKERMLRLLLKEGKADANCEDYLGMTPLMMAVKMRCVASARILLEAGAEVDARERSQGLTPLLVLLMSGKKDDCALEMLKLLLDKGADADAVMDNGVWSALSLAAHLDLREAARMLLACGASVDDARGKFGISPLMRAVMGGRCEMVRLLLGSRARPDGLRDARGYTELMNAVRRGHADVVEVLLKSRADANAKMSEAELARSMDASSTYYDRFRDPELQANFRFDEGDEGVTALMIAAKTGRTDLAQILLDHGADPRAKTALGHTALMVAVIYRSRKVARTLLDLLKSNDVNAQNDAGVSPLMLAMLAGDLKLAKLLVRHGARLFLQDARGHSALSYAAVGGGSSSGSSKLVLFLLRKDPDLAFLRSLDGRTPLFGAVVADRVSVVRALLEAEVAVNARELVSGRTALDVALSMGRKEVAQVLVEFGGTRGGGGKDSCCLLM